MTRSLGDGILVECPNAELAVPLAMQLHPLLATFNSGRAGEQVLRLRVGIHLAEVLVDQIDMYGAGVNLAARLAGLGEPGDTVVSAEVRDQIRDEVHVAVEDMGLCYLKHIDKPERAFRLRPTEGDAGPLALPASAPRTGHGSRDALEPTVAIIPLRALHGDTHSALCGELVSDGVIARLSRNSTLRVISRLSTSALKDHPQMAQAVRRHFRATYVASGHCTADGDRVSMYLELADLRTHSVLWADRFELRVGDLTSLDGVGLHEVSEAVHLAILDAELKRIRSMPFPSLESFSLLLGSISLLHRASTSDFDRAHAALQALVERAPRHGSGYALKSQWHVLRLNRGLSKSIVEDRERARQDSERAVQCDPENATAQTCRGLVLGFLDHDLDAAQQCYERALDLNPSEPMAWLFTATLRSWQGRGQESARAAERALQLSPLDPQRYYYDSLAATAMLSDLQLDRAIALAKRSLRVNRLHTSTYRVLAIAQMMSGDGPAARATVENLLALEPDLTVRRYLERYPGKEARHAVDYANALAEAGLPP